MATMHAAAAMVSAILSRFNKSTDVVFVVALTLVSVVMAFQHSHHSCPGRWTIAGCVGAEMHVRCPLHPLHQEADLVTVHLVL